MRNTNHNESEASAAPDTTSKTRWAAPAEQSNGYNADESSESFHGSW